MKTQKYEKIVKGDKTDLVHTWLYLLFSVVIPFVLLLESDITFGKIVFNAFIDGMCVTIFVGSILNYTRSRKVYWRKIK